MDVHEAITSRRSVRAFLPKPVDRATVEQILEIASRAPSGTNTQPWKVYVCAGAVKAALTADVIRARVDGEEHAEEMKQSPSPYPEPHNSRRRKLGWELYGLVGLKKGDREGIFRQHNRNYGFFDAPVGLFFCIDRELLVGSWVDTALFIQNVMVAARGFGLHTCPQAAWPHYHRIVRKHLPIPDGEIMVCGMSLGYEDTDAIENSLRSEREPVADFARFSGFDDIVAAAG